MEQFINIRVESVSTERNKELIKHCLRLKSEPRAINDSYNTFIDRSGLTFSFNRNDYKTNDNEEISNKGQQLLKDNNKIIDKRKSILKQNGKYLNSNRTNSVLSGVITFSDSIKEFDFDKLNKLESVALNCMNEICEKYNTELHYIVFHRDEQGLPHFHFSVDNFDNKTGLTFSRSKNFGSDLQDIAAKHFEPYGFNRGIPKSITNRKHLTIEEYKEMKEAQKQLKSVQEELNHTKALNKQLKADNKQLLIDYGAISNEFETLMNDFEDFILTEKDKDKLTKLKELFLRYSKNENADRMLKTLEKGRNKLKSVKKSQTSYKLQ